MRISYNWLKDYIDVKMAPEKLAQTLTMAGLTVDAIHSIPGDAVLEIEVTANRPDWLSYIGVARELSALTGAKLKKPFVGQLTGWPVGQLNRRTGKPANRLTIRVEDKKLCPRYTARIIHNVKVGESPAWLKAKLETKGLRPVNNIVDITNFCLFETGEPMHAFDLDKIEGGEIVIRKARRGEKITTIDGVARDLDESNLVIADAAKPVAIAGIMGGLNTEVNYSTKDILLEAAYFDPVTTRRASRKLGISTESSYRFERRVDVSNILYSSDRAAGLISEIAGGSIGKLVDIGSKVAAKKTVTLGYEKLSSVLGIEIPRKKVKNILSALGIEAGSSAKDNIKCKIPAFRHDLAGEIDLTEEVARIYGYDKIPATIPAIPDQPVRLPCNVIVEKNIRGVLVSQGMDEIITYGLLGRKMLGAAAIPDDNIVEIANPLTSEQEAMRPSLIPGLLNAVLWNINRKTKDLKLFELGKIYIKDSGNKFIERQFLSLAVTGEIANWATPSRPVNFFDLKGIVEILFSKLGVKGTVFKNAKDDGFSASTCASIEIGGEDAGIMGAVSKKVLDNFDIKETAYACEISVDSLVKHARLDKRFSELPKYPSVFRDISIIASKDISNADLTGLMRAEASFILKKIDLIDKYEGKQIPDGKRSLTYRLEYQDLHKTLEEKEIADIQAKILRSLEDKFGARLR